ncbi:hypothetical protein F8S13_00255 [Chloroflexia bacterium SDU3-3]|nr:hypothetical protein F8S13_00255 [Chloroflexia bacterium SDU3-3]
MPPPMIAVITGGTLAHIRPHLALCAPAYGQVGSVIAARLRAAPALAGWEIHRIPMRMAGRPGPATRRMLAALGCPASPETNADVAALLRGLLAAPHTRAVVMAAAICDFEPEDLVVRGEDDAEEQSAAFGKSAPRLHHARSATIALRPSEKLLTMVKAMRPDVALVSFKTTAGQSVEEMAARASQSLRASGSDVVLANDLHTRRNLLVYADGSRQIAPSRRAAIALLCGTLAGRLCPPLGQE